MQQWFYNESISDSGQLLTLINPFWLHLVPKYVFNFCRNVLCILEMLEDDEDDVSYIVWQTACHFLPRDYMLYDITVTEMPASRQHHHRPAALSVLRSPVHHPEHRHQLVPVLHHHPTPAPLPDQGSRSLRRANSDLQKRRKVASGSIHCAKLGGISGCTMSIYHLSHVVRWHGHFVYGYQWGLWLPLYRVVLQITRTIHFLDWR